MYYTFGATFHSARIKIESTPSLCSVGFSSSEGSLFLRILGAHHELCRAWKDSSVSRRDRRGLLSEVESKATSSFFRYPRRPRWHVSAVGTHEQSSSVHDDHEARRLRRFCCCVSESHTCNMHSKCPDAGMLDSLYTFCLMTCLRRRYAMLLRLGKKVRSVRRWRWCGGEYLMK